jgi:TusA-related sulfurtransferase
MSTTHLDITQDRCPMTFVKTKLELEKLTGGDTLEVLLCEGEPLNNVPKTAAEQGFTVVENVHVKDNVHRLVIQKAEGSPA